MDQAVKNELLSTLKSRLKGIDEKDRLILVEIIESFEQEVAELMATSLRERPAERPADVVNSVLQGGLVKTGRLDGQADFLWSRYANDSTKCERWTRQVVNEAFQYWMTIRWCNEAHGGRG
ncbi:hypothetical protein KBY58_12425 [Cyanobium sp. HWJ4-Hawea]|uniref:hypothetical protein n=1 Tax=Cyanobium sp. HWJ4-Hawea TaxID=2823713 RepID=UPI0020CBFA5F|nr:hypothetical protein [Cyanobium sp. HWJ4-Hawea]MCP9810234.1 hypothetical protein [Cyanobium sp. HWJ4-Hawea]